jgi:hypothetical protein
MTEQTTQTDTDRQALRKWCLTYLARNRRELKIDSENLRPLAKEMFSFLAPKATQDQRKWCLRYLVDYSHVLEVNGENMMSLAEALFSFLEGRDQQERPN